MSQAGQPEGKSSNVFMATTANLRIRRSAAQLHALAGVKRDIRAQDPYARRKYLREFTQAFRTYESILQPQQVQDAVAASDVVLIGDYHALPASQRFAAKLLEQRALIGDRPVVLAVEAIFSRDQHILDEWWRREIDESELRRRIRFDPDWGYDWPPFYELLLTARDHCEAVYALDCMPRGDLRRAPLHDRHAAERIAQIRGRHPRAVILVLFGESHLAPNHLPRILDGRLPGESRLTVLQNVDALYWRAAGESCHHVEAVRASEDMICVFNSTPLEKYESYRLCLDRWSETASEAPDLTPAVYNLIEGLVRFLNINCYSTHNGTQPKLLVDQLPEVYCYPSESAIDKALVAIDDPTCRASLRKRFEERGSVYVAGINTLFIRDFQLACAAEEVARFLYQACQGMPEPCGSAQNHASVSDAAYAHALETALVGLAARVLCPIGIEPLESASEAESLGWELGAGLYRAYVEGSISKTILRRLFLTRVEEPGAARKICRNVARRAKVAMHADRA
jgi:hypothetical protein